MLRFVAAIILCVLSVGMMPGATAAAERVALLIGESNYITGGRLTNPINDVAMLGEALRRAGFNNVAVFDDLDRAAMLGALNKFSYVAKDADIAVIYFSGHGVETAGKNFLLPTDYALGPLSNLDATGVSLDRVLRTIDGARSLKLVILDACRADTPRLLGSADTSAAVHIGLVEIEPKEPNTLVAFAAKAGAMALDGSTRSSPYAASLARRLFEPGLDVQLALRKVRDDVLS